jgi:hypothetical protein
MSDRRLLDPNDFEDTVAVAAPSTTSSATKTLSQLARTGGWIRTGWPAAASRSTEVWRLADEPGASALHCDLLAFAT